MAQLDRRSFLRASGLIVGGAALTTACGGGDTSTGTDTPTSGGGGTPSGTITFTTWASDAESAAFNEIAKRFKEQSGITVKVEVLPYDQIRTVVDRRLQANNPPETFRVSYTDISGYSKTGALADVGGLLGDGFGDAFFPSLWQTVLHNGSAVGVPHHTDTSALVYNKAHFAKAGITDVPETLDSAWTWDEFVEVLTKLKGAGTGAAPFAFNFQAYGAYRWFNTLFQNGGTVLDASLENVTLDTPAAREALEWTQRLFTDGLHSSSVMVRRPTYPDGIFPTQQISMIQTGDFLIPALEETIGDRFEWGATFLPRNVAAATDLGGNAVVVTAASENQEASAEWLKFLSSAEQMQYFCEQTTVLPVLNELAEVDLAYATRPDLMPVFQQQAVTMPEALVQTSTLPSFPAINQALVDNMDQFLGDPNASVDSIVSALTSAIETAIRS